MLFTEEELNNLSLLARIDITKEEKPKMLADMQAILSYISEINEVSGEVVHEEESLYNVVREDVITHETKANTEAILANAPKTKNGYVEVEQVLK